MRVGLFTLGIALASAVSGVHAQKQFDLYATFIDGSGRSPESVSPASLTVTEDGVPAGVIRVEPVDWSVKVQLLIDNGAGMGAENLIHLRNGIEAFLETLPPGAELTVVTTAPQPRFLVRATTDRVQWRPAVDRLAPDSGTGRFVDSLNEATQRIERDKSSHFPVIISVGTTAGDLNVLERDVQRMFRRLEQRPTQVHVVMVSAGGRSAGAGVNQTEIGLAVTKYTRGRYENLSAPSRIATLLPELGAEVAKAYGGERKMFKLTVERPGGRSGELGRISMTASGGIVPTGISLDGRMP